MKRIEINVRLEDEAQKERLKGGLKKKGWNTPSEYIQTIANHQNLIVKKEFKS